MSRTAWIVGLGVGAAAVVGVVAYAASGSSSGAAQPPQPQGPAFNAAGAVDVVLGQPLTVPLGSSIQLQNPSAGSWVVPGPTTSNAAVLQPAQGNGQFVAVSRGTATISGTYNASGGQLVSGTSSITVV
jgi:hypothetical protein